MFSHYWEMCRNSCQGSSHRLGSKEKHQSVSLRPVVGCKMEQWGSFLNECIDLTSKDENL